MEGENEEPREGLRIVVVPSERTIPIFSGSPGALEAFESALKETWETRAITGDPERVKVIWDHLGGEVKDELRCHPEATRRYPDQVLTILSTVYGDKRSVCQLLAAFNRVVQRAGEPIRQYANRLNKTFRDLTSKQEADRQQPLEPKVLRDQFLQGLSEAILARQLREGIHQNPDRTFFEVREEALRWAEGEREAGGQNTQVTVAASQLEMREMMRSLDELRQVVASLEKRLSEGPNPSAGADVSGWRGVQNHRRKPEFTEDGQPICFKCRKSGHISRFCSGNGRPQQP